MPYDVEIALSDSHIKAAGLAVSTLAFEKLPRGVYVGSIDMYGGVLAAEVAKCMRFRRELKRLNQGT